MPFLGAKALIKKSWWFWKSCYLTKRSSASWISRTFSWVRKKLRCLLDSAFRRFFCWIDFLENGKSALWQFQSKAKENDSDFHIREIEDLSQTFALCRTFQIDEGRILIQIKWSWKLCKKIALYNRFVWNYFPFQKFQDWFKIPDSWGLKKSFKF